jgi:tRNA dimethylallyltransferase
MLPEQHVFCLDFSYLTGQFIFQLRQKEAPDFTILMSGLAMARSELYGRIDRRVDNMIDKGLVGELRRLLAVGYSPSLPSMSGMGYKETSQFLRGEMSLAEAIDRMKWETQRLVRHQYAWFRLNDARTHWFDVGNSTTKAGNLIGDFHNEFH